MSFSKYESACRSFEILEHFDPLTRLHETSNSARLLVCRLLRPVFFKLSILRGIPLPLSDDFEEEKEEEEEEEEDGSS